MDHVDLRKFLGEFIKDHGDVSSDEMAVFGKLVRLTMQYRDEWKEKHDETLSVGETREAIDIYIKALQKGAMPADLDPKIDGLVRLWLKEINDITF